MKKRIMVTGLGLVTPIGIGVNKAWKSCINSSCGTGEVSLFDATNYQTKLAAEVKNFEPAAFMSAEIYRKMDRFAQMGVVAAGMAIEDAGLRKLINTEKNNIPVVIGSGLGGSLFHEDQIFKLLENKDPRKVIASSVPRIAPNAVSAHIAIEFKLRGTNLTISTACSSGGNAISLASKMIESGQVDVAVTGGAECPITPFTYAAYQSLMVLSKSKYGLKTPRPFDRDRDGFVLGEGAGILILEEYEKAKSRGARIYAELLGSSSNCGVYHMATPDPSGDDAALAMQSALDNSRIKAGQVDYINAHGTATKLNDLSEAKAIIKVFGRGIKGPHVSSSKSQLGHTIGAAGAIEAALTVLAIHHNIIPPNINCDEVDEECDIRVVQNKALNTKVNVAASNSFGFGSNNTVLVFSKIRA